VGRPWWYDSYWEKGKKLGRRFQLPNRPLWAWIAIIILALLITLVSREFHFSAVAWFFGFIHYLCRILAITIFIRAILSWFTVNRYNFFIIILDNVVEPILSPLRRIVPRLGMFDITPLLAIFILYIIPIILRAILF